MYTILYTVCNGVRSPLLAIVVQRMMQLVEHCRRYAPLAGRVLIGAFFLIAGIQKFMGIDGTAAYIASVGLPMSTVLAWISAIFVTVTGGMMIAGYKTTYAATLLAGYVIVVTPLFHGPQNWPTEQMTFMKNVAILGGLLFIAGSCAKCQAQKMKKRTSEDSAPSSVPGDPTVSS